MEKTDEESKGNRPLSFMAKRLYKVDTCWISPKKIFYLFFYQSSTVISLH